MLYINEYWPIFLIGFLSSFGHCVGMCGGFVTAYSLSLSKGQHAGKLAFLQHLKPHLLYNAGRIFTYTFLGLLFGAAGETLMIIFSIGKYQAMLQLIAGALMILFALDVSGWMPLSKSGQMAGSGIFKRLWKVAAGQGKMKHLAGVGMVMGFIPCGLVYAAGAKAGATGSIQAGMLTMLSFGLGTVPAMVAIGLGANRLSVNFRSRLFKVAAVLVILMGMVTVAKSANSLFFTAPTTVEQVSEPCCH